MGLICPQCHDANMKISSKIELPPDNRSDEIAVQILTCSKCNFQGIAVYEESRRGSFDNDSFSHQGYFVASDLLNDVKDVINQCKNPRNSSCQCKGHRFFKTIDCSGNWIWKDQLNKYKKFNIQFSS